MDRLEQIHQALCTDNPELFRSVIAAHPELRARINDPVGPFDSPIVNSVRGVEMLDAVLDAGADINARSRWWAGSFGILDNASDELAAHALQRGARLDVHSAARLGYLDRLREFLRADPKAVHRRGGDGQTALHFARNVEVAALLLDHGADPNARDIDHESTPVQYMIADRQPVAAFLIQRGAESDIFAAAALGDLDLARKHLEADPTCLRLSVDAESFPMKNPRAGGTIYQWTLGFYVTAHQVAAKFNRPHVLRVLLERSPEEIRLLNYCLLGDENEVKRLASPELVRKLSTRDLKHVAHAARNNDSRGLELMIEAGFPLDARGQHGASPLHWAAWHGHAGNVSRLLAAGAKTDPIDDDFRLNPLGWAKHGEHNSWFRKEGNYAETIRLLEAKG